MQFTQGGTFDNEASGSISGYTGVAADADTTLINAGTVTASGGGVVATLEFQNASLGTGSFHTATDRSGGTLLTRS